MQFATVPETPVNEYGAFCPDKHDVWPDTTLTDQYWVVNAIPYARRIKAASDCEFRTGVALPIAAHSGRRSWRGRSRVFAAKAAAK